MQLKCSLCGYYDLYVANGEVTVGSVTVPGFLRAASTQGSEEVRLWERDRGPRGGWVGRHRAAGQAEVSLEAADVGRRNPSSKSGETLFSGSRTWTRSYIEFFCVNLRYDRSEAFWWAALSRAFIFEYKRVLKLQRRVIWGWKCFSRIGSWTCSCI